MDGERLGVIGLRAGSARPAPALLVGAVAVEIAVHAAGQAVAPSRLRVRRDAPSG